MATPVLSHNLHKTQIHRDKITQVSELLPLRPLFTQTTTKVQFILGNYFLIWRLNKQPKIKLNK